MIVQCAACHARFKIADEKVTERGVKVRCSKCSSTFIVRKSDGAAAASAPPAAPATSSTAPTLPTSAASKPPPAAPAKGEAFGAFGTMELKAAADPFENGDPFADLGGGSKGSADPFAGLGGGKGSAGDPFAALGSPAPGAGGGDPFAGLGAPKAGSPDFGDLGASMPDLLGVGLSASPLSSRGPGAIAIPLPAPTAPAKPIAGRVESRVPTKSERPGDDSLPTIKSDPSDPFAHIDLGGPPKPLAAAVPSIASPPADADQTEVDLALQGGPPPLVPPQAKQSPPPPSGLGAAVPGMPTELDFDSSAPSGLELDTAPGKPPAGPPPLPGAKAQEPARSEKASEPPEPKPAVRKALFSQPPEPLVPTVVRDVQWPEKAEETSSPSHQIPRELRPKTGSGPVPIQRKRRPAVALANAALVFLAGLGLLAVAAAGPLRAANEAPEATLKSALTSVWGRASDGFEISGVRNGLYETRSGSPVFFVRGTVTNRADERRGPARILVEVTSGDSVARKREALAGGVPSPEQVYEIASPANVEAIEEKLAHAARPLDPGASAEFLVLFFEYPDDLAGHELHISASQLGKEAAALPAATAAAAKGARKEAPAPAAPEGAAPGQSAAPAGGETARATP